MTAGGYAVAQEVNPSFPPQVPDPIPMPEGDGDRNANPLYAFPNMDVRYHFVPEMPLRVSALRSLGAHLNIFTLESMLDELALAGNVDPLTFRLAHMKDERARAVMQEAAQRLRRLWSRRWRHRRTVRLRGRLPLRHRQRSPRCRARPDPSQPAPLTTIAAPAD